MNNFYEFKNSKVPHFNAKLLYISISKYGGDWVSIKHSHSFTELFYVLSGSGQLKLENMNAPIYQDSLVIINSNVEHTEIGNADFPLEYIAIGIQGLDFIFDNKDPRFNIFDCKKERKLFVSLFEEILGEVEVKPFYYPNICQSLLEILIVFIQRQTNSDIIFTNNKKENKETSVIRRYIDQNYTAKITLDTLSDISHINKYYLAHLFKKEYGFTPMNYIKMKRIKESKRLLTETNYSISFIAELLGFSSQSYFSQSFQQSEHMSPIKYRTLNTE